MQGCEDETAAAEILSRSKLDALVLDLDNVSASDPLVKSLRDSPSNKNAALFAAATYGAAKQKALEHGTSYIFERPFLAEQIRLVLRTAYAQMLRERRKYFRLAVELNISILRTSLQDNQPQPERNGRAHSFAACARRIDKAQFPGTWRGTHAER